MRLRRRKTHPELVVRHCGHTDGHRSAGEQGASKGADQHRGDWIRRAEHSAQESSHNGQRRVSRLAQPGDLKVLQYEYPVGAHHQAAQEANSAQAAIAEQGVDDAKHGYDGPQQSGQSLRRGRRTCLAVLQDALEVEKDECKQLNQGNLNLCNVFD